ncbi:hypothetical protein G6514_008311 [Epicoccum nigrum]|nr:hypothetical protein G6514_008311 [Epicoccum nigrum]
MEAIAGLSLAANILQIVELAAKLLSKGREIQQAGSTIQNSEIETITTDFTALSAKLRSWARPDPAKLGPLAHEDQVFEDLVVRSEIIAQELLSALQSLSHKKDGTKYNSWVHAFRAVWSASKIQEIQNRLQSIRDELQFRILVSTKEENIRGLDEASRNVLKDIVNSNEVLKADIHTQAQNILTEQRAEGALAADRHQEVLDTILSLNLAALSVDTILQRLQSKLYSHRQDDRFEDIAQAHQKTFTWALEKKSSAQSGGDLLNWLQNQSGTYWISGKAGSGKSTLMKYMVQDLSMDGVPDIPSTSEGVQSLRKSHH